MGEVSNLGNRRKWELTGGGRKGIGRGEGGGMEGENGGKGIAEEGRGGLGEARWKWSD